MIGKKKQDIDYILFLFVDRIPVQQSSRYLIIKLFGKK